MPNLTARYQRNFWRGIIFFSDHTGFAFSFSKKSKTKIFPQKSHGIFFLLLLRCDSLGYNYAFAKCECMYSDAYFLLYEILPRGEKLWRGWKMGERWLNNVTEILHAWEELENSPPPRAPVYYNKIFSCFLNLTKSDQPVLFKTL